MPDKHSEFTPEDLEPGDRSESYSPFDWCLAAGCGCGGCLDPTGCMDAMSQGCLGCLEGCLGSIGCGVIAIGILLIVAFVSFLFPAYLHAAGTESIDDALSVIDVALQNDELDAIETLLNPDLGIEIASVSVAADEFISMSHDTETRELIFYGDDEFAVHKTSLEDFFWSDVGLFNAMRSVTMSHSMVIDHDELLSDATIALWEHGELETAIVMNDPDTAYVYILPEMKYRLTFVNPDGLWYLTGIDARE
jgi:hypothetical protein